MEYFSYNQDEDNRGTDEENHMHKIIKDKKDDIAEICRKYDVIRLEVFGSAARGTDFDPYTSDVDFLIDFRNPLKADYCNRYDGVEEDLKDLFARKVDLVRIGPIHNPYRLASIEEDRDRKLFRIFHTCIRNQKSPARQMYSL